MRRPQPFASDGMPVTFQVGRHAVVVQLQQRRWIVSVDSTPLGATFATEADAWEAGVRESARLDDATERKA